MAESVKPDIRRFPDLESLSKAAAQSIEEVANAAIENKGRFSLVLSGGNTPRTLYRLLSTDYGDRISWSSTHLFWGDERYFPNDHPKSNYTMAQQTLISNLPIPAQNIHPVPTEIKTPEEAAASYEKHLRRFFNVTTHGNNSTFDLLLLGVGEDGHTASLFPGSHVLNEDERWVVSVNAPSTYKTRERITLTLPVINRAEKVFFLVSGIKKERVVKAVLRDVEAAKKYPAAMVQPKKELVWFLDKGAASELHTY
jgi:6-phosphogluconolactonase